MNKKPMSDVMKKHLSDVEAALGRAYEFTCTTARQFNTSIVSQRNGQVVNVFLNEKVETGILSSGKIQITLNIGRSAELKATFYDALLKLSKNLI